MRAMTVCPPLTFCPGVTSTSMKRKEQIHPAAKFDKPELCTLTNIFTLLHIKFDPAGNGSGYLPHEYLHLIIVVFYDQCGAFIFGG